MRMRIVVRVRKRMRRVVREHRRNTLVSFIPRIVIHMDVPGVVGVIRVVSVGLRFVRCLASVEVNWSKAKRS